MGGDVAAGHLAANIARFCRVLRHAGLPIGPGQMLGALEAAQATGVERRDDFYWALHAALIDRHEHSALFDQAFHIFWRNPDLLRRSMAMLLPSLQLGQANETPIQRRVAEALRREPAPGSGESPEDAEPPELELDASLTLSDRELLQNRDFEQMSAAEEAEARRLIAEMRLPVRAAPTRRFRPDPTGPRVDMRATMRASLRAGGAGIELVRRRRRTRPPPLVALCDISGSMSQYSRMALHFLHAVTGDRDRVHSFVFGTRLTNITRLLRHRDVDEALGRIGRAVEDWSGGTRIGESLHEFNRLWSRRVLGQGAVVLLITDGLDRDAGERLEVAIDRLHRSCRKLIWLNPLLRYDGYAPKSIGARILIRHIDEFRPVHNLAGLADLVNALSEAVPAGGRALQRWRELAHDPAVGGAAA